MNPTTVRVTARHIADGAACQGHRCPVALAVIEALVIDSYVVESVMVVEDHVSAIARNRGGRGTWRRLRADLDTRGSDFVNAFDTAEEERTDSHRDAIVPFETVLTWRELP